MSFGSPYLLLTLLAVPLLAGAYVVLERGRFRRAAKWVRPALRPNVVDGPSRRARHVPIALFLLALTLLLVGFARPQRHVTVADANAPTVVVVLDVSGSMAAYDVAPSRIRAASRAAARFLRELPAGDRAAVVTFGNRIQVVVPPTLDHGSAIAHLPDAITPKAGTSLGDALGSAIAVVTGSAGKTDLGAGYPGAVLVFSDGSQTAGGTLPDQAAQTAFVEHVPIDTVAVGTKHGTVTQQVTVDGFDTSVEYAVPVNPRALRAVAHTSGGTAFALDSQASATSLPDALRDVTRRVRPPTQPVRRGQALSAVAAGAALVLAAAGILLSTHWFGRVA